MIGNIVLIECCHVMIKEEVNNGYLVEKITMTPWKIEYTGIKFVIETKDILTNYGKLGGIN